jgi:hypothetical protein
VTAFKNLEIPLLVGLKKWQYTIGPNAPHPGVSVVRLSTNAFAAFAVSDDSGPMEKILSGALRPSIVRVDSCLGMNVKVERQGEKSKRDAR